MKLVGYTDRLSVAPRERIAFMVSSELPRYRADIVRLIHGDSNPAGPGFKARAVSAEVSGEYAGKTQLLRPGSYVRIPGAQRLNVNGSFTVHMWIRPTTPKKSLQTLVSSLDASGCGFAVRLDRGCLSVQLGRRSETATLHERPVTNQAWYSAAVIYDHVRGRVRLSLDAIELTATRLSASAVMPLRGSAAAAGADVLIATELAPAESGRTLDNFYNGKIDTPVLYDRGLSEEDLAQLRRATSKTPAGALGAWDFARDIRSTRVTDVSGNCFHGCTINRPTRAVAGRAWNGSEVVWTRAPEQYAAIHFHDDDLDDAGWEESLTWRVPEDTPSGIYALHIHAEGEEDYLPFAVRPTPGGATARIVFLMPTFSYLAYGNEHTAERPEAATLAKMMGADRQIDYPSAPHDKYIVANRLNSLYDTHTDGSGTCYSSWLRPILTMRPKYRSHIAGTTVPHQFNADLHLVDWLVEQGYQFDVVTDENLHSEGRALLDSYTVVMTGTHPEYWSEQMLRACQQYLHDGGRMMYLGGNGMYWVIQLDPESGHTVEMRRTQPSSPRFFDPHPGELHLSTTGERGGPWRLRGLPTFEWLGVVMSGAGRVGQHYRRRPQSFEEPAAWIFDGVGPNELIGNFKNLHTGYGAAGGEVDRADFGVVGTPHHTLVLATSDRFSSSWFWDPLEPVHMPRSDVALLEYPNGGAVFSVSSIAWCSCLSYNLYDNNISRITRNVLDGFLNQRNW